MQKALPRPLWRFITQPLFVAPVVVALALVLAVAPLRIVAAAVGLVGAVALAWLGPIWGVYAAILSVPIQQIVVLPGGTSFTQAAVAFTTAAWLLRTVAQPQRRFVTGPLFWAWAALIGALLLATSFTAYSLTESLKATLRWVVAFLVWFVAVNSVTQRWQLIGLTACLLVAPAATALLGLYQFATGSGPPSFRIAESLPFVRAYGTIGQPNSFAGYMNMAWPLAAALCVGCGVHLYRQHNRSRGSAQVCGVLLIVTLVLVAALVVSFSLGGWVGALVGAVGLLATLGRRWAFVAVGGMVVVALFFGLGGANLLPQAIGGRISRLTGMLSFFDPATVTVTPANFALVERMAQMKAGWLMLQSHVLFGVGPGAYSLAYGDVAQAPWLASRGHAHNFYLNMAAEAGLFGLGGYLALVGTALLLAVRGIRNQHTLVNRSIAIGCCGIIAAVAGHNMFENLHVLNLGVQLSGIWAIAALLSRRSETETTAVEHAL